jgi:hypothetical protein
VPGTEAPGTFGRPYFFFFLPFLPFLFFFLPLSFFLPFFFAIGRLLV